MLDASTKRELRDRGWSVFRRNAERPAAIPTGDVLTVGDDVVFEDGPADRFVLEVEGAR